MGDPGQYRDPERVAQYYRAARIGMPAAFVQTHYDRPEFVLSEVMHLDLAADRVTLRSWPRFGGRVFFISTGRNCHSPTGQSRLVVPTPAMITQGARERRTYEDEIKRSAEWLAAWEAEARRQQEEMRRLRKWIRATCLDCGHFGAVRLRPGTPATEMIPRLLCSKCKSKRLEAVEWSPDW